MRPFPYGFVAYDPYFPPATMRIGPLGYQTHEPWAFLAVLYGLSLIAGQ